MSSCKSTLTPVDSKPKVSANSSVPYADPTLYRSLAGALQYLTFIRLDISYVVQQICLHMHNPRIDHFNALKRIILYVKGTLVMDFTFIPLLSPLLSLTLMEIGEGARTPESLHLGIVCFGETTWPHGHINDNPHCLILVLRPNIVGWPMSSSNHVGFIIFSYSCIVR